MTALYPTCAPGKIDGEKGEYTPYGYHAQVILD